MQLVHGVREDSLQHALDDPGVVGAGREKSQQYIASYQEQEQVSARETAETVRTDLAHTLRRLALVK